MRNRVIFTYALSLLFILPLSVNTAAERSAAIFSWMGFTINIPKSTPRVRDRAMYAELCSLDFEQARNAIKRARQSGDDGSLGLSYGLFNLDDLGPGGNAWKGREGHIESSPHRGSIQAMESRLLLEGFGTGFLASSRIFHAEGGDGKCEIPGRLWKVGRHACGNARGLRATLRPRQKAVKTLH